MPNEKLAIRSGQRVDRRLKGVLALNGDHHLERRADGAYCRLSDALAGHGVPAPRLNFALVEPARPRGASFLVRGAYGYDHLGRETIMQDALGGTIPGCG